MFIYLVLYTSSCWVFFYLQGCLNKAVEYLKKHSLYIAIVSGSVPIFLVSLFDLQ